MAQLLNVTRGQWSMYECGLRSLPLHALQMMTQLESHLQNAKRTDEASARGHDNLDKQQKELQRMLVENELKLLAVEKIKLDLERKRSVATSRTLLSDFKCDKSKLSQSWPVVVPRAVDQKTIREYDLKLLKLDIEMEMLNAERRAIQDRLAL
jgi:hypothetical protein